MIVLKNLLNNYCCFDKYILHYYFTLNLFFKAYVQLIRVIPLTPLTYLS